jgi:hypothetical protein
MSGGLLETATCSPKSNGGVSIQSSLLDGPLDMALVPLLLPEASTVLEVSASGCKTVKLSLPEGTAPLSRGVVLQKEGT